MTIVFGIVAAILVLLAGIAAIGLLVWRVGERWNSANQQIVDEVKEIERMFLHTDSETQIPREIMRELKVHTDKIRRLV